MAKIDESKDMRLQRYTDAEFPMHRAVALLETLGILIESNFTSLDAVNLESLSMLSYQYEAAMPHLREAVETLYSAEEKQYVRIK